MAITHGTAPGEIVSFQPCTSVVELENARYTVRIIASGKKTDIEKTCSITAHTLILRCIILIVFIVRGWKPVSVTLRRR